MKHINSSRVRWGAGMAPAGLLRTMRALFMGMRPSSDLPKPPAIRPPALDRWENEGGHPLPSGG